MDEKKSDYRYRQKEERRVGEQCEIETLGGERGWLASGREWRKAREKGKRV